MSIGYNKTEDSKAPEAKQGVSLIKFENHKIPEFKEVKGKEWILYGEKNDYPDYLIGLYTRSAKHNAIVSGKVHYITGQGWSVKTDGLKTDRLATLEQWMAKPNPYESLDELTKKVVLDEEIFHGFALHIIYGKANGKIAEIYHIPFNRLRTNKDETEYYYTANWKKYNPDKNEDWKVYQPFDPNKPKGEQILYYRSYSPKATEFDVYPKPEYIGAIPYIEIDYEIANFHLNNIKKGFWGSYLINLLNGVPPDEEHKSKIEKMFKDKFTGTDNAGGVILNFAEGKDRAAELIALQPSDLDKQFIQLNLAVQQEIFTAHKVTSPMLFGIKTEGQLGGRTELIESSELFQKIYVSHKQQIFERVFNTLAEMKGFDGRLYLERVEPISFRVSDDVIAANMTQDEIREQARLPPMPKPTPQPQAQATQFSAEDDSQLVQLFSELGKPSSDYVVLKSRKIFFHSDKEAVESELNLYKAQFADALNVEVSTLEAKLLGILKKNPQTSVEEAAQALKEDSKKVLEAIENLQANDLLTQDGAEWKITPEGEQAIRIEEPDTVEISIVYKYVVDPGLNQPAVIPTTREFCRKMIEMDKVYTRSEIEQISSRVNYSVWTRRGGFYTNPKTNTTTEYCRHIWQQQVVKKIRKG